MASLLESRLVYFSGVTLSLYSNAGLGRFLAAGLEVPGTAAEERVTMAGI